MIILAIGDVFGKIGRKIIEEHLPDLKKERNIDLVIANAENVSHGKGITKKHYEQLKRSGVDIMTSGNHVFYREEAWNDINDFEKLLRPLNSNPYHRGKGTILEKKEILDTGEVKSIRITNLIGTSFMPNPAENPYWKLKKIIDQKDCDIHLVDFHAESTAEKIALALHFDGEISALWGTHTHVQTADERILPKNATAFITDLGMTGALEGVIGADLEGIIKRNKYGLPGKIQPWENKKNQKIQGQLNGVIFEFDDKNNAIKKIERITKRINL